MRAHFDVRRAGECLRVLHFGSESKRIAKWRNHTHLSFLNASLSALSHRRGERRTGRRRASHVGHASQSGGNRQDTACARARATGGVIFCESVRRCRRRFYLERGGQQNITEKSLMRQFSNNRQSLILADVLLCTQSSYSRSTRLRGRQTHGLPPNVARTKSSATERSLDA